MNFTDWITDDVKNVLLVEPNFPIPNKSRNHSNFLPIGLLKIAAYLKSKNINVELIRFEENKNEDYAQTTLISNEKDTHLLLMLVSSIEYCAFDPNQSLINSLEKLLKTTSSKNSTLLIEICDSTYKICQFMGRPALYSHGMKMITQLLFPQYDSTVQNHARETLKKITQLKI